MIQGVTFNDKKRCDDKHTTDFFFSNHYHSLPVTKIIFARKFHNYEKKFVDTHCLKITQNVPFEC